MDFCTSGFRVISTSFGCCLDCFVGSSQILAHTPQCPPHDHWKLKEGLTVLVNRCEDKVVPTTSTRQVSQLAGDSATIAPGVGCPGPVSAPADGAANIQLLRKRHTLTKKQSNSNIKSLILNATRPLPICHCLLRPTSSTPNTNRDVTFWDILRPIAGCSLLSPSGIKESVSSRYET